jgi:sulfide dehydrogenase cytochrome subunit
MRAWTAILLLILGLGGPIPVAAVDDELVEQCEGCHGPDGVSAHADVPTIAGQSESFIAKALKTFQVWGRPCVKSAWRHGDTSRPRTDMCQVAEGLTGEDVRALAAHYAALPFVPAAQAFDAGLAATGAALQEQHCETCHHTGGVDTDRAPRLAGQWLPYLKSSLKFVPTGEHLVPPAMESVVVDLSPGEIEAILNYYASQRQ